MSDWLEIGDDGVAILRMDLPGRPANVINYEFRELLGAAVEELSRRPELVGVIVTSAKSTFLSGGDIDLIYENESADRAFEFVEGVKAVFRRLETLGKPVAAVINGSAVGGGYELALACHHRTAVDDPRLEIGVPEVTLGILPAGGGVTRLVRLLGLERALPFLMRGTRVSPERALREGLIDALAADLDEAMAGARRWIAAHPGAVQPWDEPGYSIPGGDARSPKVEAALAELRARVAAKTGGHYPAPLAVIRAAAEGSLVDLAEASRIESRYFSELATQQVSKNMIRALWLCLNEIRRGRFRPTAAKRRSYRRVGVVGAGKMGSGIACATARAGAEVVLVDVDRAAAERGKEGCLAVLEQAVRRSRLTEARRDEILERILPASGAGSLAGCELVIEAVFEERKVKEDALRRAEAELATGSVLATNTSSIPISLLAGAVDRPEAFLGLHFFAPVDRMPLVEIVRGRRTSDDTVARAFDYVVQIGKTPIVVNDSPGFFTTRVLGTYLREAMAMIAEGGDTAAVEAAGLRAGMPVAPLSLADDLGLPLLLRIAREMSEGPAAGRHSGPASLSSRVLSTMVADHDRPGRAGGRGFYDYPADGRRRLWERLDEIFPASDEKLEERDMEDRFLFVQALETVHCLEEGVLNSVAEADVGSIFGWGFPAFRGGVLQYINEYGVPRFVARCRELAADAGERFEPPGLLIEMAARGAGFDYATDLESLG